MHIRLPFAWLVAAAVAIAGCETTATSAAGPAPASPGPAAAPAPGAAPAPKGPAAGPRSASPPVTSGRLPWFVTKLDNGLTVIIEEVRSRPVVSISLNVLGGSRDELPEERGGAHFLEHVFYLGTPTRGLRAIRDEIDDRGGSTLALTDYDRTEYWATCRTEDFPLALDGLADGARNALIDPKAVEKERQVILDELRQRLDDDALYAYEAVAELAFHPHPYARRRGGELAEVEALTRDHLHAIYKRHYRPDQFVVIITGDVDTRQALALVRAKFGDMPNPDTAVSHADDVPPASGFEYRFLQRDTKQTYVCIGCPAPGAAHPDAAAVDMLAEFLRARLYTDLVVTKRIATSVNGGVVNYRDLGLLEFTITPARHADAHAVEEHCYTVFADVAGIPTGRKDWDEAAELSRHQRTSRLNGLFDRQDARARANLLAWGATMGTLPLLADYADRIDAVTLEDIGRTAKLYLSKKNLNVAVVGPAEAGPTEVSEQSRSKLLQKIDFGQTPDWTAQETATATTPWSEFTLENGLRVLVGTARDFPLVTVGMFTPSGSTDDPLGLEGRAWITNSMLMIGAGATQRVDGTQGEPWDRNRFSSLIWRLGRRFNKGTALEHSYHVVTVTKSDLTQCLDMFSAAYLRPTYDMEELKVEIKEVVGALRSQADNLSDTAFRHTRQLVYGKRHPYAVARRGTLESVPGITRADLVDGYAAGIKPRGAVLVLYGDLTPREGRELARAAFGHWNPPRVAGPPLQGVVPEFDDPAVGRFEFTMDKEQAMVVIGCQAVPYGSRRYPASDFAAQLVGQWAFKELIYEKKVGYTGGAFLEAGKHGGGFFAYLQCKPDGIPAAERELRDLLRRLAEEPIPMEDFRKLQRSILGRRPLQLQRGSARVHEVGANAVLGLPIDYTEQQLAAVAALTPADVQAAARTWLDLDRLTTVVVHRDGRTKDSKQD